MGRVYMPVSQGPSRWRPGCWPFILGGLMVALAVLYAVIVSR